MLFRSKLELCPAVHAERNCLLDAAYVGTSTKNTRLYMDECVPCSHCMIELINAGVKELVLSSLDFYDDSTIFIFNNCDITIRLFNSDKIISQLVPDKYL